MHKQNFNKHTGGHLKQLSASLILLTLFSQIGLSGCASETRKEDSITTILEKENTLIEKVKAERAQIAVSEGVQKNDSLNKAELHLLLSLDEIQKANDVVATKLLNQNKKEVQFEQHDRISR